MIAFPHAYHYHLLAEVNSTNMYAMERIYAGMAVHGDVFFTEYQSQGKGQRGKSWKSAPGESILMSIILDSSPLAASQSFRMSAAIAVAVKEFIEFVTGQSFLIKWPNDVYQGDRKAGGILIENVLNGGNLKWSIVGIGINVNQESFPGGIANAVSCYLLTGKKYDSSELAQTLAGFVDHYWTLLISGGWQEILTRYNDALYGRSEIKRLRKGPVVIPCKIRRVDESGMLIAGENEEWNFRHGEVEWIF